MDRNAGPRRTTGLIGSMLRGILWGPGGGCKRRQRKVGSRKCSGKSLCRRKRWTIGSHHCILAAIRLLWELRDRRSEEKKYEPAGLLRPFAAGSVAPPSRRPACPRRRVRIEPHGAKKEL